MSDLSSRTSAYYYDHPAIAPLVAEAEAAGVRVAFRWLAPPLAGRGRFLPSAAVIEVFLRWPGSASIRPDLVVVKTLAHEIMHLRQWLEAESGGQGLLLLEAYRLNRRVRTGLELRAVEFADEWVDHCRRRGYV